MKKHKFKVGDVGYVHSLYGIDQVTIMRSGKRDCVIQDSDGRRSPITTPEIHPTPEACAQALVEEFYINNPKT